MRPVRISGPFVSKAMPTGRKNGWSFTFSTASRTFLIEPAWYCSHKISLSVNNFNLR